MQSESYRLCGTRRCCGCPPPVRPRYGPVSSVVPGNVAVTGEEMGLVFPARAILANDFDPTDPDVANAIESGVNEKDAAGCLFVDIAGDDLHIRGTVGIDGVAFVDPAALGRWIL